MKKLNKLSVLSVSALLLTGVSVSSQSTNNNSHISTIAVEAQEATDLSQYSDEEIEYARVWLNFGPNQDIDELIVTHLPAGSPVNPNDPESATYPVDVLDIRGPQEEDGNVVYNSIEGQPGMINVYEVPYQLEGSDIDTESIINNPETVYIEPGEDAEVERLIQLITSSAQTSESATSSQSSSSEAELQDENSEQKVPHEDIIGFWQTESDDIPVVISYDTLYLNDTEYVLTNTVQEALDSGNINYTFEFDKDAFTEQYGSLPENALEPLNIEYNPNEDTFTMGYDYVRYVDANIVNYVKDKLTDAEPINLEQLLEVSDSAIMAYYHEATIKSDDPTEQIHIIYNNIAEDYPELELLMGEEYNQYLEIAQLITENSDYTFPTLNTALPRDILNGYNELAIEYDNEQDILSELLPRIQSASDDYFARQEASDIPYLEDYQWPLTEENSQNQTQNEDGSFLTQEEAIDIYEKAYTSLVGEEMAMVGLGIEFYDRSYFDTVSSTSDTLLLSFENTGRGGYDYYLFTDNGNQIIIDKYSQTYEKDSPDSRWIYDVNSETAVEEATQSTTTGNESQETNESTNTENESQEENGNSGQNPEEISEDLKSHIIQLVKSEYQGTINNPSYTFKKTSENEITVDVAEDSPEMRTVVGRYIYNIAEDSLTDIYY